FGAHRSARIRRQRIRSFEYLRTSFHYGPVARVSTETLPAVSQSNCRRELRDVPLQRLISSVRLIRTRQVTFMRLKTGTLLLAFLLISCCAVYSQQSVSELEQTRIDLVTKEQNLTKAREVIQQKIDRMRASLNAQERRLESVSLRLDEVKKSIIDIDQKLVQTRPR
ncbi:MAG: hypothetical protein K2Z81_10335, partial [Cyanobacteria bacterium]|nr:hypothetical protein [Cyanobacteriota bacterium]